MEQADGCSLEAQEQACRSYAEAKGWQVVGVVSDTMSGRDSLGRRPGLQVVRKLFADGQADCLLVWRFDRSSRDMADGAVLHKEVSERGGWLESTTEGKVDSSPFGQLLLALRYYAAATELEGIVARTHDIGLRNRALAGKLLVTRNPLFGYMFADEDKSTYVVDERTAPIVRMLYTWARSGIGTREIVRRLYEQGVRTPSQAPDEPARAWHRSIVLAILQNPAYMGAHVVYRRKQVKEHGVRRQVVREECDAMRIEHPISPLVSEEDWQEVQDMLSRRMLGTASTPEGAAVLLSKGFCFCGYCHSATHLTGGRGGVRYFKCGHAPNSTHNLAKACTVPWGAKTSMLDEQVWAAVVEVCKDTARVERVLAARRGDAEQQLADAERARQDMAEQLADAERMQANLTRRIAAEDDDSIAAGYRVELQRLAVLHKELTARLAALARHERLSASLIARFETAHRFLANQSEPLSREDKRSVLHSLGVRVEVYRDDDAYTLENGRRWSLRYGSEAEPQVVEGASGFGASRL
jgi:DNA invertase Pin-like site-specific DNA recombinase